MDEMSGGDLLANLLCSDEASLAQLTALARSSPAEAMRISWTYLSSAGREQHVPAGYCERVIAIMQEIMGKQEFERMLIQKWHSLGEQGHENICYGALGFPSIISTDCALELFEHGSTSLGNRLSILENLLITRKARRLDKAFFFRCCDELVGTVSSEDQERTELFVIKVFEELEPPE